VATRACLVLGMHRSGTSAATRVLNLLGLGLSREDDLVEGPANARGFWESRALFRLNEELLNRHGGSWDAPPVFAPRWHASPSLDDLRYRAAEKLAELYSGESWLWKDPRNCLTVPFWLDLLPAPAFVFVHRHPLEVARSLVARNPELRLTAASGLALWERYLRSALSAIEGRPVFVTSFASLLTDSAGWCERIAPFLRREGFAVAADRPGREIDAFLAPSLRHQIASDELDAAGELSSEQRRLYRGLCTIEGEHPRFGTVDLGPETASTERLIGERRRRRNSLGR